jgi:hypothetical protein
LIPTEEIQAESQRVLDTDRKGLPGSVPNMQEMVADRPYGEFYDFYSVSPEYFGYHHVYRFRYYPRFHVTSVCLGTYYP